MKATSLLGHSAQLLRIVWKSPQPADLLTSQYMRDRKYVGAKDRRAISALVFSALRMYGTCERIWKVTAEQHPVASGLENEYGVVLASVILSPLLNARAPLSHLAIAANEDASEFFLRKSTVDFVVERCAVTEEQASVICDSILRKFIEATSAQSIQALSLTGCVPEWIAERWLRDNNGDYAQTLALCQSLINSAPLCIRVNTRMSTRESVRKYFLSQHFECIDATYSPHGLILGSRLQLNKLELYLSGAIEVQDEGSQLVAFALAPAEKWNILDACAGAGGKTIHLAVLQNNSGTIVASDTESRRLGELYSRAKKANLSSIEIHMIQSLSEYKRKELYGTFDAVLIDAPCSGMGTVRRSPLPKWRLTAEGLEKAQRKQKTIIEEYSRYVQPGGILLYVTCSLMREENEDVVDSFLLTHPEFVGDALRPSFDAYGINLQTPGETDWYLNLRPHLHGTDGFFIARMKRVDE